MEWSKFAASPEEPIQAEGNIMTAQSTYRQSTYEQSTYEQSTCSTILPVAGALTGAGMAATLGNMGLVGGFGGISVGAAPVVIAGAIAGSAVQGAMWGIQHRDSMALGAVGLGVLGGGVVSVTVGGMGLAGSFGAVSVGLGSMAATGGILGLGIYGLLKTLDSGPREPIDQVFARMEDRIAWQQAYTQALLELTLADFAEDDILRRLMALDIEDDLQRLKAETQRRQSQQQKPGAEERSPSTSLLAPVTPAKLLKLFLQAPQGDDQTNQPQVWLSVHTLNHHSVRVNAIAFTPDGQSVVSGSDDGQIILWDLRTGNRLYTFSAHWTAVLAVAVSPDGALLVGGGVDQKVTQWNLTGKFLLNTFRPFSSPHSHEGLVHALQFSASSKTVVSGSADRTIRVWRYETGNWKQTLSGHTDAVFAIALTPDGTTLVSGSADRTVRIWSLTQYAMPRILTGHMGWVNCVAIHSDGKTIISGSADQTLKFWDLHTGELLLTLSGHQGAITSVVVHGNTVVSGGSDGMIRFWKVERTPHQSLHQSSHQSISVKPMQTLTGYGPIALSPDGRSLVCTGPRGAIRVWQLQS